MRKPDNGFIDQFRERFGDLLLTCNRESGKGAAVVDAEDPVLPVGYEKNMEVGSMQVDNTVFRQKLERASGSSVLGGYSTSESLFPMGVPKKRKASQNCCLPGSGAVLHNRAGDLHSPMIQWNAITSPLHDTSFHHDPPIHWADSDCFTPLAQTRINWQRGEPIIDEKQDYKSGFLTHRECSYIPGDGFNPTVFPFDISPQTNTRFDFITSEANSTRDSPCNNGEEFRYHVTLQAPTAMLRNTKEQPMTYLNKGQTYTLKIADSNPPMGTAGLHQYKTSVRVTFEEESQRADPIALWQLWKEGRGLDEANKHQSELLAVEYDHHSKKSGRSQGYRIRLVKAYVDGFCITWTADPTTNVHVCAIPLRFNFLSTDFSRSKGVKGVPVRLCAKTETILPEGGNWIAENDSELCYCIVKLFRDHGAERKSSNDVAQAKKKIEKLRGQITDSEIGWKFVGPSHGYDQPRKRKWSTQSWKDRTVEDLRIELARTNHLLSSARQMSVLRFRGTEQDDPDLHPVNLVCGTDTMRDTSSTDNRHTENTSTSSTRSSASPHVQPDRLQSPGGLQYPLEIPNVPVATSKRSTPATLSFKAVACFYVQISPTGKLPPSYHHAIYLAERTYFDFKEKLGERMQVDPRRIARILWRNSKGLEIMVDEDVVQHLPEGQLMAASIREISHTEVASSLKPSVEIELVF